MGKGERERGGRGGDREMRREESRGVPLKKDRKINHHITKCQCSFSRVTESNYLFLNLVELNRVSLYKTLRFVYVFIYINPKTFLYKTLDSRSNW
jgi:hypothetical protein